MADINGIVNGIPYTIDEEAYSDCKVEGLDLIKEVEDGIKISHPTVVEIYSKDNCKFCVEAKYLLEKKGFEYTELSAVDQRDALIERVTEATGKPPMTVPQIFINGEYIGGHDALVKHFAA